MSKTLLGSGRFGIRVSGIECAPFPECQSTPDFDHARITRERPGSYRWFVAPFFEVLYVAPFNHLGALSRFECA